MQCISLMGLIRQSYVLFRDGTMNLSPVQVVPLEKAPAWIDSDLYTIEAKSENTPGTAPPSEFVMLGPMMQALLEERFKVKVHREVRQVPVYELKVGKDRPRLQTARPGTCMTQNTGELRQLRPGVAPLPVCGFALMTNSGFEMRGATMEQLSTALSGRVDRSVVDRTGIGGTFDIRLDASNGDLPGGLLPPPPQAGVPLTPGPDPAEMTAGYRAALLKLGLRLEPAQGPGDFLVVDRLERPSEN